MAVKHLCLLMLAVVAFGTVSSQLDGEPIPVENDNQFPPDIQAAEDDDGGTIQGSGDGTIQEPEEPSSTTTESLQAPIEEIQPMHQLLVEVEKSNDESSCPEKCLCTFEDIDFVTDCSSQELTEFPSGLDPKTTKLRIQNNKLTEIPKQISTVQNLKFLNASGNSIADLASGSISELYELVILDLSNNRLVDYPRDLKNGFSLTKLEELHLGGNDMRTPLGPETFVMLTSLTKITVPSSAYDEQLENTLCKSLKDSLKTICVEACYTQELVCPDGPDEIDTENEMLDVKIPGAIFSGNDEDYIDPTLSSPDANDNDTETKLGDTPLAVDTSTNETMEVPVVNSASNFSFRTEVDNEPEISPEKGGKTTNDESTKIDTPVENTRSKVSKQEPPETESAVLSRVSTAVADAPSDDTDKNNAEYKVGAKTVESKGGGVDKSVIGMVVAGMVVVIAGITIKKNWSSIRKKFSSNSRTPNDRPAGTANGAAPEEVPLQDKSPV